jgi:hypothetical protein
MAWSWRESTLFIRHLERLPGHVAIYAGTLSGPPTDRPGVAARRKAFCEGIRGRFGRGVGFLAVAEVGPVSGRLHDHYAMCSADGAEVSPADVESLYRDACGGRVRVDHGPIGDIGAWVRYAFKADAKYHDPGNPECVRLLARGSPRITWGTRGFLPGPVKAELWSRYKAERFGVDDPPRTSSRSVRCDP